MGNDKASFLHQAMVGVVKLMRINSRTAQVRRDSIPKRNAK